MLPGHSPAVSPLTTVLVWALRLLIPVLLFWTYYKFQQQKFQPKLRFGIPQKNVYSRHFLIRQRLVAKSRADSLLSEARSVLPELPRLVTEAEAPKLFAKSDKKSRGSRKQKTRTRDEDEQISANEMNKERGKNEMNKERGKISADDKMNLESLLNYVAFNRKEQRNFHPDSIPPPPPSAGEMPSEVPRLISTESMERANQEAQMVLKAAVDFNRGEIAKDLWKQLSEANVEITSKTFTLLVEACIHARDLRSASDFLMKMEANGYCPSDLLDKVMELYSVQNTLQKSEEVLDIPTCASFATPQASRAPQTMLCPESDFAEWGAYQPRRMGKHAKKKAKRKMSEGMDKMSPDAPVFVPAQAAVSLDAPVFVPAQAAVSLDGKLNAEAVPFQPMHLLCSQSAPSPANRGQNHRPSATFIDQRATQDD